MGDPSFDLANFSAHHEFSDQRDSLILEAWFGEATPSGLERLRLMKITSDCPEAMWAQFRSVFLSLTLISLDMATSTANV